MKYSVIIRRQNGETAELAWNISTVAECYEIAWQWYALTGETVRIFSNFMLGHRLDANQ